jgi:hypothetical protein
MRKQNWSIALLWTAWFAPFALPVTIRVTEPTGSGVAHAQIRLVPSPDKVKLETDGQGQLSIGLKAGAYALFVSVPGFKKAVQHIDIGNTEGQIVPVVLQVADVSGPTAIYPYPRESLVLTADPYHAPVALSPADFRALPHITITVHNGHTNSTETYSGVLLATLLAKVNAPIGKEFREEALTSYLIAAGSDGYSVLLSLAEVDPSFHGGQVLVSDTRDGQPLAKSGPFELIVLDDKRPTRWVRSLSSITLQHAR